MVRRWILAWLPAALWAALIFVLSSIPGTSLPTVALPQADKMVHALMYATLGALTLHGEEAWAPPPRRGAYPRVPQMLLAAGLATLYGVSDEIHQLWTPNRSADWHDVAADAFGGAIGALAFIALRWMKVRACLMMGPSKD